MTPSKNLRIAINVNRLPDSGSGTFSVLAGLIHALGTLEGPEEYVLICPSQDPDWCEPYIGTNQCIVSSPTSRVVNLIRSWKWMPNLLRKVLRKLYHTLPRQPSPVLIPESKGFYESLGVNLIHFPTQEYVRCKLPSIYNPHDLQHVHYPQFFTPETIIRREALYRTGCDEAHTIVVASEWIKKDIEHHYRINPKKIQVIPWAPPTQVYSVPTPDLLSKVQVLYNISDPFILYPAATWKHKNHLRLLEALALLRDTHGIVVHLICTGSQKADFWPYIEERLITLKLKNQVCFLGVIPGEDLRALYRIAQFVVIPTLFEAASGPVFEAWQENTPIACSNVTSLPEQVRNAAILFDPFSVEAIADVIRKMVTDKSLRENLRQCGRRRLHDFSWERTAKAYRAVYRRAAGESLNEEDHYLLQWDWMKHSMQKKEVSS